MVLIPTHECSAQSWSRKLFLATKTIAENYNQTKGSVVEPCPNIDSYGIQFSFKSIAEILLKVHCTYFCCSSSFHLLLLLFMMTDILQVTVHGVMNSGPCQTEKGLSWILCFKCEGLPKPLVHDLMFLLDIQRLIFDMCAQPSLSLFPLTINKLHIVFYQI